MQVRAPFAAPTEGMLGPLFLHQQQVSQGPVKSLNAGVQES